MEVSPLLAYDMAATTAAANELHARAARTSSSRFLEPRKDCLLLKSQSLPALLFSREVGAAMPADGGDCEHVLAEFAKAGIDVDSLATQSQSEGAKAFDDSWNDLMKVIASKSAALQTA